MAKEKRPKQAITPSGGKAPVSPALPTVSGEPLRWRFSEADRDGAFSFHALMTGASDGLHGVLARLAGFGTMTETELGGAGSHAISISRLAKVAQDRLLDIGQDDLDQLWPFRLNGTQRLWCIQRGGHMNVLWWDPNHKVCPSVKKHT